VLRLNRCLLGQTPVEPGFFTSLCRVISQPLNQAGVNAWRSQHGTWFCSTPGTPLTWWRGSGKPLAGVIRQVLADAAVTPR